MSANVDMTAERRRHALRAHTERLADSVGAAAPDVPVPTCPGWTISDLVAHVGQTQRWVAEIIERRIADPTQLPTVMADVPVEPDDWPTWLRDGAARAADACSDDALEASVFNAAADGRTGGQFWLSSLLNEAVVHGVDAALAAGRHHEISADVASELIGNHLSMLTSPTWAWQRPESAAALSGRGETVRWRATDLPAGGDWLVERRPDGARRQAGSGAADATVTGPAAVLLLVLTRRCELAVGPDRVSVDGDVALVRHWIDHSAHVSG